MQALTAARTPRLHPYTTRYCYCRVSPSGNCRKSVYTTYSRVQVPPWLLRGSVRRQPRVGC